MAETSERSRCNIACQGIDYMYGQSKFDRGDRKITCALKNVYNTDASRCK